MNTHETIRALRLLKGFTRKEVAFHLGISQEYYGRIERGEANLSLKLLEKIAGLFDVPMQDLLSVTLADSQPSSELEIRLTSIEKRLSVILKLLSGGGSKNFFQ
jgi:transcriptional regulator with XRE-family HTH domain